MEIKCQLDATEVFIADLIACPTCFGRHCAHHQELKRITQWLLPVVFGAVVFKLLVWCGAEGYVSGLQDAAMAASCKPDTFYFINANVIKSNPCSSLSINYFKSQKSNNHLQTPVLLADVCMHVHYVCMYIMYDPINEDMTLSALPKACLNGHPWSTGQTTENSWFDF